MRWLLPVVLAACVTEHEPAEPQVTAGVTVKDIPISINQRADVLFVIDDSAAMAPYAANVRANLGRFVEILRTAQYGVPNLRLAVIAGDGTSLRTTSGMLGQFAVDFVGPDANRVRNYDGDLADVFARLSDVGTSAPTAQPFAAARVAIDHPTFLRDDAMTFVFVITASETPLIEGEKLGVILRALHDDPSRVVVGGVAPADSPAVDALLQRFPNRNTRGLIDDPDWATKVFEIIARSHLVALSLGSPCIEGPLVDLEVLRPGLQPSCTATYLFPIGGEIVPPCVGDLVGTRCFRVVENQQYCPTTSFGRSWLFKLDQPRTEIPEDTHMWIECLSRYDE